MPEVTVTLSEQEQADIQLALRNWQDDLDEPVRHRGLARTRREMWERIERLLNRLLMAEIERLVAQEVNDG